MNKLDQYLRWVYTGYAQILSMQYYLVLTLELILIWFFVSLSRFGLELGSKFLDVLTPRFYQVPIFTLIILYLQVWSDFPFKIWSSREPQLPFLFLVGTLGFYTRFGSQLLYNVNESQVFKLLSCARYKDPWGCFKFDC